MDAINPQSLTIARAKGGRSTPRRLAEAAARRAFACAGYSARRLPTAALPALAPLAALLQLLFSPERARNHDANLKRMLPPSKRARVRRAVLTFKALRSFGLFILEFLKISRMSGAELMRSFTFEHLGELDRAHERGCGTVIVTSHIGNWEAGARALAHLGYRLHVVAGVQFSRALSPCARALKERAGVGVVSPGWGEYRRLVEALRANEAVALVVDGDAFDGGADVPFFGGTLRAPAGPARLAALTGASVISTHVVRIRPMRFRMAFRTLWSGGEADAEGAPRVREALSAADGPAFVRDLTSVIMQAQEEAIGRHPDQWCIFRPLWPSPAARAGDETS